MTYKSIQVREKFSISVILIFLYGLHIFIVALE